MAFRSDLFEKISIESLTEPFDNSIVYMNRYWIIHEGSVLKFNSSWQCNQHPVVIEQIMKDNPIYEDCTVQYYEYLYLPR